MQVHSSMNLIASWSAKQLWRDYNNLMSTEYIVSSWYSCHYGLLITQSMKRLRLLNPSGRVKVLNRLVCSPHAPQGLEDRLLPAENLEPPALIPSHSFNGFWAMSSIQQERGRKHPLCQFPKQKYMCMCISLWSVIIQFSSHSAFTRKANSNPKQILSVCERQLECSYLFKLCHEALPTCAQLREQLQPPSSHPCSHASWRGCGVGCEFLSLEPPKLTLWV